MFKILFILLSTSLVACTAPVQLNENAKILFASAETQPVESNEDAADDPAIWINQNDASASLILGTDKKNGLAVYNLSGELVQFLPRGRLNNVDLRQNIKINGRLLDLAVATNRTSLSLDIFSISSDGTLEFMVAQKLAFVDPYGICMGTDDAGNVYAFANDKTGEYQQWHLNPNGLLNPTLVGSFVLGSQPEGCAVDDQSQTLYLGEENVGLWKMPADANAFDQIQLLDRVGAGALVADVEGMDIYSGHGQHLLVVSSQGDYSYALYDLTAGLNDSDRYLGSVRVADNIELGIDGSEETDGLAVTATNLGGLYSQGLLVVQDGFNRLPKENQNFKLIPFEQVLNALDLN